MLPFTRMPHLLAPPMPPKKLRGTEITRAQGQEITRKMRARWSQPVQSVPARKAGWAEAGSSARAMVGRRNRAVAAMTTQGV